MKVSKKEKKSLIFFTVLTIVILLIVAALIIALGPIHLPFGKKEETKKQEKVEIVVIHKEEGKDTTRGQAVEATVEQFRRLGEEVTEQDLQIRTIMREERNYYYIKSPQNSIMIDIKSGEIVRVNSVSL